MSSHATIIGLTTPDASAWHNCTASTPTHTQPQLASRLTADPLPEEASNDCVLALTQAQRCDSQVYATQLVLMGHVARQAQHGGVVQSLLHGQALVEQVVLVESKGKEG
jgi:hypothetical protein